MEERLSCSSFLLPDKQSPRWGLSHITHDTPAVSVCGSRSSLLCHLVNSCPSAALNALFTALRVNRPPCAWNIPSLTTGSSFLSCFFFFFYSSHSPPQSTPCHLVTRIEAAERHWRGCRACGVTLAHPGVGVLVAGPPQQAALAQDAWAALRRLALLALWKTSGWMRHLLHSFLFPYKKVYSWLLCSHTFFTPLAWLMRRCSLSPVVIIVAGFCLLLAFRFFTKRPSWLLSLPTATERIFLFLMAPYRHSLYLCHCIRPDASNSFLVKCTYW